LLEPVKPADNGQPASVTG